MVKELGSSHIGSKTVEAQTENDFAIIRQIIDGQRDKYRVLVDRYKGKIFSMIYRQVQDAAITEELSQEVFIKTYLSLEQFKFECSFQTWLTCICLNHTNSYFYSKAFKQKQSTQSAEPDQSAKSDSNGFEELHKAELLSRFKSALADLAPKYREIVVLCILEERSYEEAAGILGIPLGTVRSRLSKARKQLKDYFSDLNDN